MLKKLSIVITDRMIHYQVIAEEEAELYIYALCQLFKYIILFIMVNFIGLSYHNVLGILFFTLSFIFLRSTTGGFHMKSDIGCLILSMMIVGIYPLVHTWILMHAYEYQVGITIGFGLLQLLLPIVDHPHKIADDFAIKFFSSRKIKIVLAGFTLVLTAKVLHWENLLCAIAVALIVNVISNIIGLVSRKKGKC